MSYILELNLREEINAADWLLIDTPSETMRVSAGALSRWIGGVKTVNNVIPDSGNVNLTPDQISDIASGKKFVTVEEKARIALIRNTGSGSLFLSDDGTYKAPAGGGGGGPGLWGTISGDITTQTDLYDLFEDVWNDVALLNTRLGGKQDALGFQPENQAQKGQPGGYVPLDASSKIDAAYLPEGTGTGPGVTLTSYRSVFRFDSNLYTEDETIFRGKIRDLSGYFNDELSNVTFGVRLSTSDYTACATLTDLQQWVNTYATGNSENGVIFFIKVYASYRVGSSGLAEYVLSYTY